MEHLRCKLDGCNNMCCFSCADVDTCKTRCDYYDSVEYAIDCKYCSDHKSLEGKLKEIGGLK